MQRSSTGNWQRNDLLDGPKLQELGDVLVGQVVSVYWLRYRGWYDAKIMSYNDETKKHR